MKDDRHWKGEDFRQRMTISEWREVLLAEEDTVLYRGRVRQLKAEKIVYGVVEVFKEPLSGPAAQEKPIPEPETDHG